MKTPWTDLKVAFYLGNEGDWIWDAIENEEMQLPSGWELIETYASCAVGYVAIFRVNGRPLTIQEGLYVEGEIERNKP